MTLVDQTAMPFFPELQEFLNTQPTFRDSLKLANPKQFAPLRTIIISRLPDGHLLSSHVVLGITYLDKENLRASREPLFKQDFVVGLPDGTFVSYTAPGIAAAARSPYVKPIGDFEKTYGDGGQFYTRPGHPKPLVHHFPDVDHLPPEQQEEARQLKAEFTPTVPGVVA